MKKRLLLLLLMMALWPLSNVAAGTLNDKLLSARNYTYNITMERPGAYLVVYKENGTTNVKKVIIN